MTIANLDFYSTTPKTVIHPHTGGTLRITITLLDSYSDLAFILSNSDYPQLFKATYTGTKGIPEYSIELVAGKYALDITPENIPTKIKVTIESIVSKTN